MSKIGNWQRILKKVSQIENPRNKNIISKKKNINQWE